MHRGCGARRRVLPNNTLPCMVESKSVCPRFRKVQVFRVWHDVADVLPKELSPPPHTHTLSRGVAVPFQQLVALAQQPPGPQDGPPQPHARHDPPLHVPRQPLHSLHLEAAAPVQPPKPTAPPPPCDPAQPVPPVQSPQHTCMSKMSVTHAVCCGPAESKTVLVWTSHLGYCEAKG